MCVGLSAQNCPGFLSRFYSVDGIESREKGDRMKAKAENAIEESKSTSCDGVIWFFILAFPTHTFFRRLFSIEQ